MKGDMILLKHFSASKVPKQALHSFIIGLLISSPDVILGMMFQNDDYEVWAPACREKQIDTNL